ncbi:MAG: hypothetical protein D6793_04355 [Thermoflexia bacterium]|nr:MAG: hypothetical protein D6793_04355 [Thermoflexia bacterium]
MLLQAAQEMGIHLSSSWLIGGALSDMVAAWRAGCGRYMVLTGRGRQELVRCWKTGEWGFRVALDLDHAIRALLQMERISGRISVPVWDSW